MEGISRITYKGKEIICADYAFSKGNIEKTIQFINVLADEYCKYPPKSALCLTNLADFSFNKEVLSTMKATSDKCQLHQKKIAIFGLKPIHQAAFNFGFAITFNNLIKVFSSEEEAKEWLVKD